MTQRFITIADNTGTDVRLNLAHITRWFRSGARLYVVMSDHIGEDATPLQFPDLHGTQLEAMDRAFFNVTPQDLR